LAPLRCVIALQEEEAEMIDGVSQSSGVERILEITRAGDGLMLVFRDRKGGQERARVSLPADDLLSAVTNPPAGGGTVGAAPDLLEIEVRRNEVLLSTAGADAAVGLDDLLDGLEKAISA